MERDGWETERGVKTILDIVLSCLFSVGRSSEELDTSRNTLQPSPLRDGKLFEPSLSWRRERVTRPSDMCQAHNTRARLR